MTDWKAIYGSTFLNVNVLVTGGAGFIGSHLASALAVLGARVRIMDDLSGGDTNNITTFRNEFTEGTILDYELLEKITKDCTFVFHQAALGSVPDSIARPHVYYDVNITGTFNVLEVARNVGVKRVMFAASAAAYGASVVLPKVESMSPSPISPYAANKVAGEALMTAYANSYGLDTVSLRYFNIFGPRQNANSSYAAVIAAFAKKVMEDRTPVIYGDGEQSRDFTFVDNVVHANLLAAKAVNPLMGQVLNIATGTSVTVNELAKIIIQLFVKNNLKPIYYDTRPGDIKHSVGSIFEANAKIGYTPIVSFYDGLVETLRSL